MFACLESRIQICFLFCKLLTGNLDICRILSESKSLAKMRSLNNIPAIAYFYMC